MSTTSEVPGIARALAVLEDALMTGKPSVVLVVAGPDALAQVEGLVDAVGVKAQDLYDSGGRMAGLTVLLAAGGQARSGFSSAFRPAWFGQDPQGMRSAMRLDPLMTVFTDPVGDVGVLETALQMRQCGHTLVIVHDERIAERPVVDIVRSFPAVGDVVSVGTP